MKRLAIAYAVALALSPVQASAASDSLITLSDQSSVYGYKPAGSVLVTPTGGTQKTLANALSLSQSTGILPTANGGTGQTSVDAATISPTGAATSDSLANFARDYDIAGLWITPTYGQFQGNPTTVTVAPAVASATSITNPNEYDLVGGTLNAPTFDTTNVSYRCGTPTVYGTNGTQATTLAGLVPTNATGKGRVCLEFIADTTLMEIKFFSQGGSMSVEIDGKPPIIGTGISATAQAGGASTITLAAGASAVTNFYVTQYVLITGGTGVGQQARITAYNGTTKVATVASAWATNPDNTSTYILTNSSATLFPSENAGASRFELFTFSGPRASHYVRVTGTGFRAIMVDSSGSITRPSTNRKQVLFAIGDSYGAGTGADNQAQAYTAVMAKNLGLELENSCAGGTGVINPGTLGGLNYQDRTLPPVNAWTIFRGSATGGSYTLTQNGITSGSIQWNDNTAAVQSVLDAAFGSGNFFAAVGTNAPETQQVIVGRNANASFAGNLVINSSLTGTLYTPKVTRYVGDIAPIVPVDSAGNKLHFFGTVQCTGNDTAFVGSLQATMTTYLTNLAAAYPQATWLVIGTWMNKGPVNGGDLTLQTACQNAANAALPTINGRSPFISTFDATTGIGYLNGTTNVSTASGLAGITTDWYLSNDATHPTPSGHDHLGNWDANRAKAILTHHIQ